MKYKHIELHNPTPPSLYYVRSRGKTTDIVVQRDLLDSSKWMPCGSNGLAMSAEPFDSPLDAAKWLQGYLHGAW